MELKEDVHLLAHEEMDHIKQEDEKQPNKYKRPDHQHVLNPNEECTLC